MLKEVHRGMSIPGSFPVDPTAEFQPGMICQLKTIGNDIVAGVSDGTAPLGIIDDVRITAFTRNQIDEFVDIAVANPSLNGDGRLVTTEEVVGYLEFPNIIESSFVSSSADVILNPVNAVVTLPIGTELNYDFDGDGTYDGIRTIVSYTYQVPGKPGDDSTAGSGKITVHYQRGFYSTDQFDTRQVYPLNCTLYVGLDGKFTSEKISDNHPGVAILTGPPSSMQPTIEFLWL